MVRPWAEVWCNSTKRLLSTLEKDGITLYEYNVRSFQKRFFKPLPVVQQSAICNAFSSVSGQGNAIPLQHHQQQRDSVWTILFERIDWKKLTLQSIKMSFLEPAHGLAFSIFLLLIPWWSVPFVISSCFFLYFFLLSVADWLNLSKPHLERISDQSIMSSLIIISCCLLYFFVGIAIAGTFTLESIDLFFNFYSWITLTFTDMSWKDSLQEHVQNVQETVRTIMEQGRSTFGTSDWWPAVESVRESFEKGENGTYAANQAIDKLRERYNQTESFLVFEALFRSLVGMKYPEHMYEPFDQNSTFVFDVDFSYSAIVSGVTFTKLLKGFGWLSRARLLKTIVKVSWFVSVIFADGFYFLFNVAGQFFVFCFLMHQLSSTERDPLQILCFFALPTVTIEKKLIVTEKLRRLLIRAVMQPVLSAHSNAFVVLVCFTLLQLKAKYVAMGLVYMLSLFQLIQNNQVVFIISLPWIVIPIVRAILFPESLSQDNAFEVARGFILYTILPIVSSFANEMLAKNPAFSSDAMGPIVIRRKTPSSRVDDKRESSFTTTLVANTPQISFWLTDFSIALGIRSLGMPGVLFGPALVAFFIVFFEILLDTVERTNASQSETTTLSVFNTTISTTATPFGNYSPFTDDQLTPGNMRRKNSLRLIHGNSDINNKSNPILNENKSHKNNIRLNGNFTNDANSSDSDSDTEESEVEEMWKQHHNGNSLLSSSKQIKSISYRRPSRISLGSSSTSSSNSTIGWQMMMLEAVDTNGGGVMTRSRRKKHSIPS